VKFQKSPPLVPVLSQINSVYIAPSYVPKIHFNIIYPPILLFLVVSFLLVLMMNTAKNKLLKRERPLTSGRYSYNQSPEEIARKYRNYS
jgi:hypothetical protein